MSTQLSLHGEPARYAGGFQEVAKDTWAWLQPNGGLGESNAGLVIDGERVLLIDTLWDVALTRRMLAAAGEITPHTPQLLFNTHSDGDHCWGNQLLADARIVSTSRAKDLMLLDPPAEMRRMRQASIWLGRIGSLPLPLIGTLDLPRLPRLPLREMGRLMAPYDWSDIELTLPSETFDGRLDLQVGTRAIELLELGPAHTDGDAVAWCPDVSVCFAADILFIECTPIMWAGPVSGWIAALDALLALGAEHYVPGHGPLCTATEVATLREYFDWIQREAVPRVHTEESPTKVAREMLFSREFGSLPWASWEDPARLVVTLHTQAHRDRGRAGHLSGSGRTRAVLDMQVTQAELARASRA